MTKPVQISIDEDLLKRIDSDPFVKKKGRSAFIRATVNLYFKTKKQEEIDVQIKTAYSCKADELSAEIEDLIEAQAWPSE